MNDGAGFGTLLGVRLDLRHQIVVEFRFDLGCPVDVDVVLVCFEFVHLFISDKTSLALGFRERDPDPAQQDSFMSFGKKGTHRRAPVSPGKRRNVRIMGEGCHRIPRT